MSSRTATAARTDSTTCSANAGNCHSYQDAPEEAAPEGSRRRRHGRGSRSMRGAGPKKANGSPGEHSER